MSRPIEHYEALLAGDIGKALSLMEEQRGIFERQPEDQGLLSGYSVMVFNAGAASRAVSDAGDELEYLAELQNLQTRYPIHEPTAARLSRALVNSLFSLMDLGWRLDVVDALSPLTTAFPNNRRIRERFVTASLLTHLPAVKTGNATSAVRLSEAVRMSIGSAAASSTNHSHYAVMLLNEQQLAAENPSIAKEALEQLRTLQRENPHNADLAVFLVMALSGRKAEAADLEDGWMAEPYLDEVRRLYALFPEPVAKHFAAELSRSLARSTAAAIDSIVAIRLEELRDLRSKHLSNERVLSQFASGLTFCASYAWYGCRPLLARRLMAEFDGLVRSSNQSTRLANELREMRRKTARRSLRWAWSGVRHNQRTQFVAMLTVILTITVWKWIVKSP